VDAENGDFRDSKFDINGVSEIEKRKTPQGVTSVAFRESHL